MTRSLAVVLMACLAFAGTASASVQKGDTELEFLGGWLSQSGSGDTDFAAWFISGGFNYFVSDSLSFGVGALGTRMELNGTTSTIPVNTGGFVLNSVFTTDREVTVYGAGVNARLHFNPTGRWVPYIGAQAKWVSAQVDSTGTYAAETSPGGPMSDPLPFSESTDTNGILYGPIAGFRIELNESNDFFVEGQYHLWSGDIGDVLDSGFGVFLGIVHQFR